MTLPATDMPFVLLDDSRSADAAGLSLLFHSPDRIICARSVGEVATALAQIDTAVASGAYVAGWMAYECGSAFEPRIHAVQSRHADEPLIWMLVTRCRELLSPSAVHNWLQKITGNSKGSAQGAIKLSEPSVSITAYRRAVTKIKNLIDAGDIYQANFTFPYDCVLEGSSARAYQNLRARQPVEYSAFINTGSNTIMSFSPELFFRRTGNHIQARPMKGTSARCASAEEDMANAIALSEDEKSRAENLMIVDLIRNDLSRVALNGSVSVTDMFTVQSLPTLHQMTSGVEASVDNGLNPSELLKALFPCGSVTGAPKVRAMEIIAELETGPRGVYCGAIGHFSPASDNVPANWSLNVPIRTVVLDANGKGRLAVGSGIVADSDIDDEYAECLLKAAFAVQADSNAEEIADEKLKQSFHLIETMRLQNGDIFLKDRHIARVMASARHFGIPVCEQDIIAALRQKINRQGDSAAGISGGSATDKLVYKIRMTVDLSGNFSIGISELERSPDKPLMVGVAQNSVDSMDPMQQHKTSKRSLYDRAAKFAGEHGLADILFLNDRGELAEGAISNIFIETADGWYTPPLRSGALPGVFRAEMLEVDSPGLEEKTLFMRDLVNARALYIGNALRGLRKVQIQKPDPLIL